jgi:predicted DNA-binding protein
MAAKKKKSAVKSKPKSKTRRAIPKAKSTAPSLKLSKDLERRLAALATQMQKSMDAVLMQALCEFADAWEDHFRTVKNLQDDDRIQLSVKPD